MKDKFNFCTILDIGSFSQGIALYESLLQHLPEAHLFVLALDSATNDLMKELTLQNITVIPLSNIEDNELFAIRQMISIKEYRWVCVPAIISYILKNYESNSCTYLNNALYFFNSLKPLIEELEKTSIALIENNFPVRCNEVNIFSRYSTQFITFKKDKFGLAALNWWRNYRVKWFYNSSEPGKYYDQKELDDWPQRFKRVSILQNPACGVKPANIKQYTVFFDSRLYAYNLKQSPFEIIFYHFYQLYSGNEKIVDLSSYDLPLTVINYIYKPYIEHLFNISKTIKPIIKRLGISNSNISKKFIQRKFIHENLILKKVYPESVVWKQVVI